MRTRHGLRILLLLCLGITTRAQSGPSGQVAYLQNDALFVRTLPDGTPVEVSPRAGSPQWSPTGKWLSYTDSTSGKSVLGLRSADGRTLHFPLQGEAAWSPVEDAIVFGTGDGLRIVRPDRDGDEAAIHLVFQAPDAGRVTGFCWNSAGNRLGVIAVHNNENRLWDVPIDGSRAEEIPVSTINGRSPIQGAHLAGWSSDDQRILLWPNPDNSASIAADGLRLVSVPLNGAAPEVLFGDDVLLYDDFVEISPRRPEVAVTLGGNREAWTHKRLTLVDPVTRNTSILTDAHSAVDSLAWSPDGLYLAYVAGPDNGAVGGGEPAGRTLAQRRLWVVDADSHQARQLTSDSQFRDEYPTWSKDGRWIVFTRIDRDGKASLWSIDINGEAPVRLLDGIAAAAPDKNWIGYYGHVSWSSYFAWSRD